MPDEQGTPVSYDSLFELRVRNVALQTVEKTIGVFSLGRSAQVDSRAIQAGMYYEAHAMKQLWSDSAVAEAVAEYLTLLADTIRHRDDGWPIAVDVQRVDPR